MNLNEKRTQFLEGKWLSAQCLWSYIGSYLFLLFYSRLNACRYECAYSTITYWQSNSTNHNMNIVFSWNLIEKLIECHTALYGNDLKKSRIKLTKWPVFYSLIRMDTFRFRSTLVFILFGKIEITYQSSHIDYALDAILFWKFIV
jgi:hypothetical protein